MLSVIECGEDKSVDVSDNKVSWDTYPHFYSGAFMSAGYPTRQQARKKSIIHEMFLGGRPPHTYTILTLHSSPSLLSGAPLWIEESSSQSFSFKVFSVDRKTPTGRFTAENEFFKVYDKTDNVTTQAAAFLFSFEGNDLIEACLCLVQLKCTCS